MTAKELHLLNERRRIRRRNLKRYMHTQSFNRLAQRTVGEQRPIRDFVRPRLVLSGVAALLLSTGLNFVIF